MPSSVAIRSSLQNLRFSSTTMSDIDSTLCAPRARLCRIVAAIRVHVPDATGTVAGKAKIATTAIAQAGTNDTDIITSKKLRDALNATGGAPIYAFRAWGIIGGTRTPASLIKGGNVASITDKGVGRYQVVFTTPLESANYAVLFGNIIFNTMLIII